jgi:glutathione S-transferase
MWQLYQFPICPFCRKVRLMLGEKGVPHELVRESLAERDEFLDMTRAADAGACRRERNDLIDPTRYCEYFEETIEKSPMIPGTAATAPRSGA